MSPVGRIYEQGYILQKKLIYLDHDSPLVHPGLPGVRPP
jgi:hypothetical protein